MKRGMALAKVALAVTSVALPLSSSAAAQFDGKSELVGLSLAMTQAQVSDFISKNYPSASVERLPVGLSNADHQQTALAGVVFDARPSQSNDVLSVKNGVDRIKVLFDPNDKSSDIFAVYRYINFENGTRMTMASVEASLVEKYGRPAFSSTGFLGQSVNYIWAAPDGHFNVRTCNLDRFDHYSYFHELVYIDRPLAQAVSETARDFANVVTGHAQPNRRPLPPTGCGTILSVFLRAEVGNNNVYAYEMKEDLVDLTRGVEDMARFRDTFFAASSSAQSARISRDTANKPKL